MGEGKPPRRPPAPTPASSASGLDCMAMLQGREEGPLPGVPAAGLQTDGSRTVCNPEGKNVHFEGAMLLGTHGAQVAGVPATHMHRCAQNA